MIYLDNSATTRPCAAAVAGACRAMEESWHNPSALYGPAVDAEREMASVRARIARAVGARAQDVVFTAGGTEADSLALLGSAARWRGARRVLLFAGEHPAVLGARAQLEAMGHTVQTFPAGPDGVADLDALSALLDEDVALVSCMQVNNETGAVQPTARIRALMREKCPDALLHVDGVQGFLRLPSALTQTGADLYCLSAHKIHGLKGVGALVLRQGVPISPRVAGGGQERGLRSGTENTCGIAALGAALSWAEEQAGAAQRLREMKLRLYDLLRAGADDLHVNGPDPRADTAAPHILNLSFPGVGGEVMLHALEAEGVLVGTGSACSSKKREMRSAFQAMNAPRWAAESAVRFSLGLLNTPEEMDRAAEAALRCFATYRRCQRRAYARNTAGSLR